jgi:hypothetical protein
MHLRPQKAGRQRTDNGRDGIVRGVLTLPLGVAALPDHRQFDQPRHAPGRRGRPNGLVSQTSHSASFLLKLRGLRGVENDKSSPGPGISGKIKASSPELLLEPAKHLSAKVSCMFSALSGIFCQCLRTEDVRMRLVLAIALLMAATAANAQTSCVQSGTVLTCDNGATGYTSGNVTTLSGGSDAARSGNGTNARDRTSSNPSNGYTSGNVTTFDNGRSCFKSGTVWSCN